MLLHEIPLDVIRAPNASKPNKDVEIIRYVVSEFYEYTFGHISTLRN